MQNEYEVLRTNREFVYNSGGWQAFADKVRILCIGKKGSYVR